MTGKCTWKGDDGTTLSETFRPLAEVGKFAPALAQAFAVFREVGMDIPAIEAASAIDGEPKVLIHVTDAKYRNPRHWELLRYDPKATLDSKPGPLSAITTRRPHTSVWGRSVSGTRRLHGFVQHIKTLSCL